MVCPYVQLQVQHQLAVTGKHAADVAVLLGGQELQVFRIERDDELIGKLIALEQGTWGYVGGQPATADGSDSADAALRALYPQWRDPKPQRRLGHECSFQRPVGRA